MKIRIRSIVYIALIIALIGLSNTYFYHQDQFVAQASATGTITASSLNVRKGAGTNYDVLVNNGSSVSVKKGAQVTIVKEENDWYLISFQLNGTTVKGYVLGEYVSVKNAATSTPKATTKTTSTAIKVAGKVTATKLTIRLKPSTTASKLVVKGTSVFVVKNQSVTIIGEKMVSGSKWYYISFKDKGTARKGYVHGDYIKLSISSYVKGQMNSSSAVKVQTAAGSGKSYLKSGSKVVSLQDDKLVLITKEVTVSKKKWFQISFMYGSKRIRGYVLASKVEFRKATTASTTKTGTVNATVLKVRVDAGTDQEQYVYEDVAVTLTKNQKVTIVSSKVVDNVTWYQVSFTYQDKTLKGYVSGDYIILDSASSTASPSPSVSPTVNPSVSPSITPSVTPSVTPTINPSASPTVSPSPTPTVPPINVTPLTDAEFEQSLTTQGFPESYKPYLRSLHQLYPYWQFTAMQTGLDWNSVIMAESVVGKNLITNSKTIAWKSLETKAYNWETDKFIPYDGSSWVTASKQAIEYYMDPRNFLTPRSVFQFESLEYRSQYQNQAGVDKILQTTPMYNTKYAYTDEMTGLSTEYLYSETFMKAAEYSGVSPYHLASRVKQEVVSSSTTLSSSVSGTVAGYEGYYNFYNIGAFHSTTAGGAIANALKFAMNGTTSQANNAMFLIPWNNPYKSIVGGAKYIGNNYINKGQNTGYLQKFNVTSYSMFNHQYMANVEAANSEAAKTYAAYSSIGEVPIVFSIPVYMNMPETPCPVPTGGSNPNNWLKTLAVSGYSLTPTFSIADAGNIEYTVIVDSAVSSVNISATPVSTTATVSGTGAVPLVIGNNRATIQVTAQTGEVKVYTVNIIRSAGTN